MFKSKKLSEKQVLKSENPQNVQKYFPPLIHKGHLVLISKGHLYIQVLYCTWVDFSRICSSLFLFLTFFYFCSLHLYIHIWETCMLLFDVKDKNCLKSKVTYLFLVAGSKANLILFQRRKKTILLYYQEYQNCCKWSRHSSKPAYSDTTLIFAQNQQVCCVIDGKKTNTFYLVTFQNVHVLAFTWVKE